MLLLVGVGVAIECFSALPVHRLCKTRFFTDRFDRPQPITQSVVIRNKDQAVIAATSVSKR